MRPARPPVRSDNEEDDDQKTSLSVEELAAELEALSKRLAPLSEKAADLTAEAPLFRGGGNFCCGASHWQLGRL